MDLRGPDLVLTPGTWRVTASLALAGPARDPGWRSHDLVLSHPVEIVIR